MNLDFPRIFGFFAFAFNFASKIACPYSEVLK